MCRHENHMLTGTASGIFCHGCGAVFHSFDEIQKEASEREEAKMSKKRGGKKKDAGQLEDEPEGV